MAKIKLDRDVFFIINSLKRIDKSYFVMFDTSKKNYEVHSDAQKENSYCFSVPYDILDARTIDYCLKTRSENREKLLKELEKHNKELELLQEKRILSNAKDATLDLFERRKLC